MALFQSLFVVCLALNWQAPYEDEYFYSMTYVDPAEVPALIDQCSNGTAKQKYRALQKLAAIGPEAKAAVPVLVERIDDDSVLPSPFGHSLTASRQICFTLESIGTECVPDLIRLVTTGTTEQSKIAAFVLMQIGPSSESALPALKKRFADRDIYLRTQILSTIGAIDHHGQLTMDLLIKGMSDPNEYVRAQAAVLLGQVAPPQKAVLKLLLNATKDSEPRVRAYAVQSLGAIGQNSEKTLPAIASLMTDQSTFVEANDHIAWGGYVDDVAVRVLEDHRYDGAVAALTSELANRLAKPERSADSVIRALGAYGPQAKPAVNLLIKAVSQGETSAALTLTKIGGAEEKHLKELRQLLNSKDEDIRTTAAAAMIGLGAEQNSDATQIALDSIVFGRYEIESDHVISVLLRRRPVGMNVTKRFVDALNHKQLDLSGDLLNYIAIIGPKAREAGPALVEQLDYSIYMEELLNAICAIGHEMIPLIVDKLRKKDLDPNMIIGCAAALERFGNSAKLAVPILLHHAKHRHPKIRAAVIKALGAIQSAPELVVPQLTNMLKDSRAIVRAEAVTSLARYPEKDVLLSEVLNLLEDEYIDVRAAAASALTTMQIAQPANVRLLKTALVRATGDSDSRVQRLSNLALDRLQR